ncbi:MAG: DUF3108 domain-containing protein [Deltaproteobacteria bacterium]|nr:DUF3108 domain-containing protein [Deltaproteobacteria bacterium]
MSKDHGFYPGEKLTFEVNWSFIKAAEVSLEILPYEELDGKPVFHFLYTAKTSKFVDAFYKVRDRIESFTDIDLTHSLLYKKRHEGKSFKDITVKFDWEKMEAQYIKMGNVTDSVKITENTFDPLSVFYAFRIGQPDTNNEIITSVSDGKKVVKAAGKILKREKIKVAGKSYNTLLVEPEIEGISGVFKKTSDSKLRIWVTDDKKRIPVRIKSKVTVGSFVADLISYTAGSDDCSPSGLQK